MSRRPAERTRHHEDQRRESRSSTDLIQECVNKPDSSVRALLGMKLHTDGAAMAYGCRKAIGLMSRPCNHTRLRFRTTDVPVREIRYRKRSLLEERILRFLDGVPADVRDAACRDPRNGTTKKTETTAHPFLAVVEEKLHAEADTETRKPGFERFAHHVPSRLEASRRCTEGADPREDEHIGVPDGGRRARLETHLGAGSLDRFGERVKIAGPVVEYAHAHSSASRSAVKAASIIGHGPIEMRTASPTTGRPGIGRMATPVRRMAAAICRASCTGTRMKLAQLGSGARPSSRTAVVKRFRISIASAIRSRTQRRSLVSAAMAVCSAI